MSLFVILKGDPASKIPPSKQSDGNIYKQLNYYFMMHSLKAVMQEAESIFQKECNIRDFDVPIPEIKESISLLKQLLHRTRELVINEELDIETEIYCFRTVKPQLVGRIIFLWEILELKNIEIIGLTDYNIDSLAARGEKIKQFIANNRDIVAYYRTDQTFMDEFYFTRKNFDCSANPTSEIFDYCSSFSTRGDLLLAQLICYEYLAVYLKYRYDCLCENQNTDLEQKNINSSLTWTLSKVDLVELGYSLYASGALNNGNAEINEIMELLSEAFNIEVDRYYNTYNYLRGRKKDRTPFLSKLIRTLTAKMDLDDQN